MEKLVRDRIPIIMRDAGVQAAVRYVDQNDKLPWLYSKLREEADELEAASTLDECADVFEVLRAIAAALGYSLDELVSAADSKREVRGGFRDGCILTVDI
ncbi:nucleoside triphosphate pyrophosphohydrolase [Limnobacter sp.]|jgi:predicted house-cleaning noncanonical NTP pyrophosphatase (MazG superfamily)|uniref:nucleoside triphosphate pyrophosphohydrolase n=1 Tax=Limnobacter sp. TaxID=2003368 RepID=UPI00311D5D4B